MPTLGVCGDSWLSAVHDHGDNHNVEGMHFTQLLADKLGYEYKTFAKGAVSNSCIRIQIEQMIEEGVDFIIASSTSTNRFEMFFDPTQYYDPGQNIFNFNYAQNCGDISADDPRFGANVVISDTLSNVISVEISLCKV